MFVALNVISLIFLMEVEDVVNNALIPIWSLVEVSVFHAPINALLALFSPTIAPLATLPQQTSIFTKIDASQHALLFTMQMTLQ